MSQDPTVYDFYNLACIREIVEPKPGTLMLPELVEKIRADYALVAKLPQFEDTKARFVPSVDECWIVVGGDDDGPFVWQDWPRFTDKWEPLDDWARDFWTGKWYSTWAAAERAAKEQGNGN